MIRVFSIVIVPRVRAHLSRGMAGDKKALGQRKRPRAKDWNDSNPRKIKRSFAISKFWTSGFLPPSPPAEKAAAREDQTRQTGARDGAGNIYSAKQSVYLAVDAIGDEDGVRAPIHASGPEIKGPKAAWHVAANINLDRSQKRSGYRVEGVDFAGDKAEIAR